MFTLFYHQKKVILDEEKIKQIVDMYQNDLDFNVLTAVSDIKSGKRNSKFSKKNAIYFFKNITYQFYFLFPNFITCLIYLVTIVSCE